jgi:hypothetical protein
MDPRKNGYFEPTDNASKSMLPATLLGARYGSGISDIDIIDSFGSFSTNRLALRMRPVILAQKLLLQ